MKMTIHLHNVLLASALFILCHQPAFSENTSNKNEGAAFSLSLTNDSGTKVVTIKMPSNDALRILEELYWMPDRSIREQALTNGILKITGRPRAQAVATLESNKLQRIETHHEVQGAFDRPFESRERVKRHYLYIRLPKAEAFELLKAATNVGDSQFRYQVMEFGLAGYKGTSMQEEVLSYLDQIFETQEPMVQSDILFIIRNIDLSSKHSMEILQKAMLVKGDDRLRTLVRKLANDLEAYRKTGDPKLLEPYNVSMP